MERRSVHAMLAELEQMRHSRVLLYVGQDRGQFSHQFSEEDISPLFACLRQHERVERLDLVLHTTGGSISAAHGLCHLLHTYGNHVSVLVPYKARSAGTLLCLGAHEIVMGPVAQLSPVDPQMARYASSASGNPPMIAAEDIRAFPRMAQSWFGIAESPQNLHLLQRLCEHIFPTSLTAFFRAAQQVEVLVEQHLRLHLPEASPEQCHTIAEYFLEGCYSHDHIITRTDATEIGLSVTVPSPQEEALLWRIWETCSQEILSAPGLRMQAEQAPQITAVIASTDFLARCLVNVTRSQEESEAVQPQHPAHLLIEKRWEITHAADA
jgi:serine dehydrogenase proteinase